MSIVFRQDSVSPESTLGKDAYSFKRIQLIAHYTTAIGNDVIVY
jgi:hypothetical protein